MTTLDTVPRPSDGPALLTVSEAAAELRIGRALAYELARRYLATNESEGPPVIRASYDLR